MVAKIKIKIWTKIKSTFKTLLPFAKPKFLVLLDPALVAELLAKPEPELMPEAVAELKPVQPPGPVP